MLENRHTEISEMVAQLEKISNALRTIVKEELINLEKAKDDSLQSAIWRLENCSDCVSNADGYLTSILNNIK